MKKVAERKLLILIDSTINIFLGIVLLAYSDPIVQIFGLPVTESAFYPTILGAILFGIGIALYIESRTNHNLVGLGLDGAISINMMGGIVLFIWLISGNLNLSIRGKLILWILDILLVGISTLELLAYLRQQQKIS